MGDDPERRGVEDAKAPMDDPSRGTDDENAARLRFDDWRRRSATGAVMTGIALGLREALELPDQRPALVIEAPGGPGDPDRPIDLRFDPDDPSATVAVVRVPRPGGPGGAPAPGDEPERHVRPDGGIDRDGAEPDARARPDGGAQADGGAEPDARVKPDGGAQADGGAGPPARRP